MVRIITDSAADFEPFELEKLNIACIPLSVMLAGKEYRENIDLSKKEFYELLASTGATPQTSQPSPDLLFDQFKAAKDAGDEAIYISISSGISGTYQTALITKDDVDYDGCYVFDSLNATAGERMPVCGTKARMPRKLLPLWKRHAARLCWLPALIHWNTFTVAAVSARQFISWAP